ncbi:CopD family protein [Compostibacter hankyongensis]|uniref:Protoporphyrinogen IX oxidase n=1 Tax=Compostibacter hankyongensis TaxID=1007089 RepID=A0ABP8FQF5_9BACT
MYLYVKALHIIFIVTWFSGMFYMVRLFIYNREAQERPEAERTVLQRQYSIMIRRLWLGITWPSAILTLIFGPWMLYLYGHMQEWLWVKLAFVLGLYLYHFSLQHIYRQQMHGIFRYSSTQLRIWNEVATIFLIAIVFLAVLKSSLDMLKGIAILLLIMILLMMAIRIYKRIRVKGKG